MSVGTEVDQVIDALRSADRLLLTTHENPDGDALGSLLAMHEVLRSLGKDATMFMAADEFPLPHEYRHMPLDGVVNEPPADVGERLVVFLDCGNIDRMPVGFLQAEGVRILNIDHHHDNTRFGTVNLVDPGASCTAEIVFRIAKELGVELTPACADALYVGLVTDTGRFMYENTSPEAHRMAAELIDAGVVVDEIYRRLYENLPFSRIELLGRALAKVSRFDQGRLTVTSLTREDFVETGSAETDSEGIVDHVRAVEGTAVAALIRDLLAEEREGSRKVSLRATDGQVDVSAIARRFGGGGHRQAAGFSTREPLDSVVELLRREVAAQLWSAPAEETAPRPTGVLLVAKPAGVSSHAVVARIRRGLPSGTKVGHAGTLDPFATGLLLVLVGRATRAQRFLMGLPKTYRAVARLGWRSDTGDPTGAVVETGRVPADLEARLRVLTGDLLQRPPAYSAVRVGGERLYRKARRGEGVEGAPRPVSVHRFEALWREGDRVGLEVECSAGTYIRTLVADLGDALCEELERTRIGPFALEQADEGRLVALADALSFLPERQLGAEEARRVVHGLALEGEPELRSPLRLMHDGALLAVAESRAGALRTLVVFPP